MTLWYRAPESFWAANTTPQQWTYGASVASLLRWYGGMPMVYSAHSFPHSRTTELFLGPDPWSLLLSQGSSFRVAQRGSWRKERAVIPDVNHNVRIASNSLASSIQSLSQTELNHFCNCASFSLHIFGRNKFHLASPSFAYRPYFKGIRKW